MLGTSSCSTIDRGKIVPYTKRPDGLTPGRALYYASTFQEGLCAHSVLVKTREGRPLHLEGNAECAQFRGKTSLRALGDILGLYDPDRLQQPLAGERPSAGGRPSTWEQAETELAKMIGDANKAGKSILLLTDAVMSPTRKSLIENLKKVAPGLRHSSWEPAAPQPEILAARAFYGEPVLPQFHLDRADVILSLQSDFLGSDGNAPPLIRDYAARRKVSNASDPMNRLWVIEGCMSITGANADERLLARPSRIASLAFALARHLHESSGVPLPPGISPEILKPFDLFLLAQSLEIQPDLLKALCADLRRAGKASLVISGPALPVEAHIAGHLLNTMLGAEGYGIDRSFSISPPELLTYSDFQSLLNEASEGAFAAAIFWGTNPAYTFPDSSLWKKAIAQIPQTVRIGLYEDETAHDCQWRLPENHWLESWGDFKPSMDLLTLRQPAIGTIYDTKQGEDILLSCLRALGAETSRNYHDYLKDRWRREVYPSDSPAAFENFWHAALHDGILKRTATPRPAPVARPEAVVASVRAVVRSVAESAPAVALEAVLLPGAAVYDGRYANNGWLNELPDPVTKATWGNPLLLSISDAARLGVKDHDLLTVTAGTVSIEVPVIVQPGQAPGVVSLSLGYGRHAGNVAASIGVNAYRLIDAASAAPQLRSNIVIARAKGRRTVPITQTHHRLDGRDNARSWTLAEYSKKKVQAKEEQASLIPDLKFPEHKWEMAIDLSACVGCSACVIACQSENNSAVVGPERVAEGREMHWIRIDRYYEGDPKSPSIILQPVLCQHCDNAPCEIVCPVNATTHSPDGLNQMTYNRCVGTRYCSNNCPYKARRFNFFEYTAYKKTPESFVYNPEVSVRPRGVMEKCTFCIQRIQDAKRCAKVEGRRIADGEIKPACAAACPAEAIVFGDANDPNSSVTRLKHSSRSYHLLEELGVKPSVTYLADISNPVRGRSKG